MDVPRAAGARVCVSSRGKLQWKSEGGAGVALGVRDGGLRLAGPHGHIGEPKRQVRVPCRMRTLAGRGRVGFTGRTEGRVPQSDPQRGPM